MARAVWRKDTEGKEWYVGHVPPGYRLKDGEHYGRLPNEADEITIQGITIRRSELNTKHVVAWYDSRKIYSFAVVPNNNNYLAKPIYITKKEYRELMDWLEESEWRE